MKRHENIDIDNGLELLTVGQHTYTSEKRFTMDFQYPNNWRLKITNATKSDEGLYECQVSTHPTKVIQVNLHVNGEFFFPFCLFTVFYSSFKNVIVIEVDVVM